MPTRDNGTATLGVIWWADDHRNEVLARTMGVTTFAIANLFFSFTSRDELTSVFSFDFLEDRKFLMASGLSVLAIVLGTELGFLQRILQTTSLSLREWLACIGLGLVVVAFSEVRKIYSRRHAAEAEAEAEEAPLAGSAVVA